MSVQCASTGIMATLNFKPGSEALVEGSVEQQLKIGGGNELTKKRKGNKKYAGVYTWSLVQGVEGIHSSSKAGPRPGREDILPMVMLKEMLWTVERRAFET